MKFCPSCGTPVTESIPEGDHLPRKICPACGEIFYRNPKPVVGTIPVLGGRVLLCLRNIEPRAGFWTLPAGFMEWGESIEAGALRETREEAGIDVELGPLFSVYSIPEIGQFYLMFLATMKNSDFEPGHETREVRFFAPEEIPWADLAFPAVRFTLEQWVAGGESLGRTFVTTGRKLGVPIVSIRVEQE